MCNPASLDECSKLLEIMLLRVSIPNILFEGKYEDQNKDKSIKYDAFQNFMDEFSKKLKNQG